MKSSAQIAEEFCNVPHGEEGFMKLSEGVSGGDYMITGVPEESVNLQRLLSLDILPGSKVKLVENPSFGALMVRVRGDELALSRELASKIKVKPCRGRKRHRYGKTSKSLH